MKIAITGVSSTGKTSLSKLLAKRLGYKWLTEGCNGAFKWIDDNKPQVLSTRDFSKMTPRDHFEFEKAILATRPKLDDCFDNFVADGEPFLWMSYMITKCALHVPASEMESVYKQMMKMVDKYDYIWYCPMKVFPIESDGYRIDDPFFLKAQNAIMKDCIAEYTAPHNHKCKVLTLQASHKDYRVDEILRVLENDGIKAPILS